MLPSAVVPAALLLDLDGTLIESERLQADALAAMLHKYGATMREDERDFVVGHAWQEIYHYMAIHSRLGWDLQRLQDEALAARRQLEADGDSVRIIEGGAALVALATANKIPVAVVSGSSREEVAQAIEMLGIGNDLRFFLGAQDYAQGKPAPDAFLIAAQRLGVEARACVVVEDSDAGITAALAAGMQVIATRAALPPGGLVGARHHEKAHRIVDDLRAITWSMMQELVHHLGS